MIRKYSLVQRVIIKCTVLCTLHATIESFVLNFTIRSQQEKFLFLSVHKLCDKEHKDTRRNKDENKHHSNIDKEKRSYTIHILTREQHRTEKGGGK